MYTLTEDLERFRRGAEVLATVLTGAAGEEADSAIIRPGRLAPKPRLWAAQANPVPRYLPASARGELRAVERPAGERLRADRRPHREWADVSAQAPSALCRPRRKPRPTVANHS